MIVLKKFLISYYCPTTQRDKQTFMRDESEFKLRLQWNKLNPNAPLNYVKEIGE